MGYDLKIFKVISTLPTQLEPNALYLVRVGDGFDFYVTTNTEPTIARKLNAEGGGSTPSNTWNFNLVYHGLTEIYTSFSRNADFTEFNKIDGIDEVRLSVDGGSFNIITSLDLPISIPKDVLVVFQVSFLDTNNANGILNIKGNFTS